MDPQGFCDGDGKAVVLQACAAALLEEYCDSCQDRIAQEMAEEGKLPPSKIQPGYGDFDICHQEMLLKILQADKTIGLTMTKKFHADATKSVTALIGISTEQTPCHRQGARSVKRQTAHTEETASKKE